MFRLVSMDPYSGWVFKKIFYAIDNVLLITRTRITFSKIHYGLTLVDLQLDAQNSCLFTYNTFILILILINVLYVNKQEFCVSSWRSTKVILWCKVKQSSRLWINPLNPELNPICYLLALLGAHHFLHVSRIRIKLTFRLLMSYIYIYIYGAPILDVSRSHTTTQHSR